MKIRIFITILLLSLLGCKNVLQETATTNTQEAILYQAKLKMNSRDYQAAIALLTGAKAQLVAAGGVAGAEGSVWLAISGTAAQENDAAALMQSVAGEPAFDL